jgi:hypothetical protein
MTTTGTRLALSLALLGAVVGSAAAQDRPPLGIETDQPLRRLAPAPVGWETLIPPPTPKAQPDPRLRLEPLRQGVPDVTDRLDRQQNEAELVKTTLLNRFGGLGFAELGSFFQEGPYYAAEVKTIDDRWIWILIDPNTGEIIPRP